MIIWGCQTCQTSQTFRLAGSWDDVSHLPNSTVYGCGHESASLHREADQRLQTRYAMPGCSPLKPNSRCETSCGGSPHHEPAVHVLTIPELLESILLELPMRDLLLAQRVNLFWKSTMDGSPLIQRALYFEAVPPTRSDGLMHEPPIINPLLYGPRTPAGKTARLTKMCHQRSIPVVYFDNGRFGKGLFAVELSPGFKSQPWPRDEEDQDSDPTLSTYTVRIHLTAIRKVPRQPNRSSGALGRASKCFAEGSWRRMFTTQPLCKSFCTAEPYFSIGSNSGPCRMGEIWEAEAYVRLEVGIVGKVRSYERPLPPSEWDSELESATGGRSEEAQAWWKVWMRWQKIT